MGLILALLLLATEVCGQQSIATTDDGRQMYFSSSYRQKGTDQAGYSKIFRFVDGQFELFRQIPLTAFLNKTNSYLASNPSVSGDGRIVAYDAFATCTGGSNCIGFNYNGGYIAGLGAPDLSMFNPVAGPDGQFAITVFGSPVLRNLVTGVTVTATGYQTVGDAVQSLANNGVALLKNSTSFVLWNGSVLQTLPLPLSTKQARVNPIADTVVYESQAGGALELHSLDLASRRDTLLDSSATVSKFYSQISNDGSLAAYVEDNQVLVQPTSGSGARSIGTPIPEGVAAMAMSGYANVIYALSNTGRIMRYDVATGPGTELTAPVSNVQVTFGSFAPGGLMDLTTDSRTPEIQIDGAPSAPVVISTTGTNSVRLQIPWDAPVGAKVRVIASDNTSFFEAVNESVIQAGEPTFFTQPGTTFPSVAIAAHQDFHALVSATDPATPGEVLHLYFTGLGAVTPSIATGAVTPSGVLYGLKTKFSCTFPLLGFPPLYAAIYFAGLAPGMIGVDQVDLQLPNQLSGTTLQLECSVQQDIGEFLSFAVVPIRGLPETP